MNKTITIFGSSIPTENDEQYKFAYQLGAALAKNGFNVCTGGYKGIMEAASKGAFDNGGLVYGVTVDLWNSEPNPYITIEVREEKLFERITKLLELGDAYVILQGGTGTLLRVCCCLGVCKQKSSTTKTNYLPLPDVERNC